MPHIVIIGSGPAGEAAAKTAAKNKWNVTLVEKDRAGGLCLNRGCIPSKTILSICKKFFELKKSPLFGEAAGQIGAQSVWDEMKKEKDRVISQLRADLEKSFKMLGVRWVQGKARFNSKNSIEIESESGKSGVDFDKAVIAAGSSAIFPPPTDQYFAQMLDSDRIFDVERLPQSIVIVGGGAVGCEFACLFGALGSRVTLIEKTAGLLPGEDAGIAQTLRKSFEARGISIFDSATIANLAGGPNDWNISLSDGNKVEAESILVCTGRKPDLRSLGIEAAGIKARGNLMELDGNLRTSNPNVYAAGDVTGLSLLAHAGTAQGECAAKNASGSNQTYDGSLVPRCLYTWPEVASVGQWKESAERSGIPVKAQRFFFQGSGRALADGQTEGFVQILSHKDSGEVLGAQMIGPSVTELIHIISVALKKQMTRDELKSVIFAHPTFSETIRWALER